MSEIRQNIRHALAKFGLIWLPLALLVWLPTPMWVKQPLLNGVGELVFLTALMGRWLFHRPSAHSDTLMQRAHRNLGIILILWWCIRFLDLFPDRFTHTTLFALTFDFIYLLIYLVSLDLFWHPGQTVYRKLTMLTLGLSWLALVPLMALRQPEHYHAWWPSMVFYVFADGFLLIHWRINSTRRIQPAFFRYGLLTLIMTWLVADIAELLEYLPGPLRYTSSDKLDVLWWLTYAPFWFLLHTFTRPWPVKSDQNQNEGSLTAYKTFSVLVLSTCFAYVLYWSQTHQQNVISFSIWVTSIFIILKCRNIKRKALPSPSIEDVQACIERQIARHGSILVASLATTLGFNNPRILDRYLRQRYRLSLNHFIRHIQINLLSRHRQTGLPLTEAVQKAGFRDLYHCQQVLDKMGFSPAHWETTSLATNQPRENHGG